ncbi:head maturation protease, ClpP-related [Phascolarctobacterium succinatutens]|uniref:head maturation protease, ClpP-related n=1 Tax=Phascolarctobacterium succinatutens TaxID=626940 RepID=UPI003D08F445
MNRKFWNWVRNDNDERILMLNGEISNETWFGDEITPEEFRGELNSGQGKVTVWINSPGGDCFAAAQIYNMLMEYPGTVDVHIDGIAASAASVIAMAGNHVAISPVGMMMIHNPATVSIGDEREMKKAMEMLSEVKESIINAYELKTGLPRKQLSNMMNAESWMNAQKAVELGFADSILYDGDDEDDEDDEPEGMIFSRAAVTNSLLNKLKAQMPKPDTRVDASVLNKRLDLIGGM